MQHRHRRAAGVQLPAQTHFIYPSPLETVRSLLTIIVMALFALTFILQPFRIPSESMERTLLVGDFLLVNKSIYGPEGHLGTPAAVPRCAARRHRCLPLSARSG